MVREFSEQLNLSPIFRVRTTLESESDAQKLAESAVENRLCACAQISGPIRSHYRWENQLQSSSEWELSLKSTSKCISMLLTKLRVLHPYKTPEIIVENIYVDDEYAKWVNLECGQGVDTI